MSGEEAAPVAGESAATVERVARAMWEATSRDRGWRSWDTLHAVMRDPYYRLALAAITALETPDAAAVRRVLALADELIGEARTAAASADPELTHPYINAACRIRAAVQAGQP
jgi:hypothetical protein